MENGTLPIQTSCKMQSNYNLNGTYDICMESISLLDLLIFLLGPFGIIYFALYFVNLRST